MLLGQIANHYDRLEKEMLDEFGEFLQRDDHCIWVHWNMRDINYGFQALEHRHKVLSGHFSPKLPEERKMDLARALVSIYGVASAGHPRLESIVEINKITDKDFLVGKDEAAAFDGGEFVKIHQSTFRKVGILANLFGRTRDGTLKTNASWWEARGIHPKAVAEHWGWTLFAAVASMASIIGLVLVFK